MKLVFTAIALLASAGAFAQTYTPTAPTNVPATMPAPSFSMTAGKTLDLTWNAVTEDTGNNPLPVGQVLYYDVWQVSAGSPPVLLQSGLTVPERVHANMSAGTDCYVVTATLAQAAGAVQPFVTSDGSAPLCVLVTSGPPPAVKPAAPGGLKASSP